MKPADRKEVLIEAHHYAIRLGRLLGMLEDDALGIASSGPADHASNWHRLPVHRRAVSDLIQDIDRVGGRE